MKRPTLLQWIMMVRWPWAQSPVGVNRTWLNTQNSIMMVGLVAYFSFSVGTVLFVLSLDKYLVSVYQISETKSSHWGPHSERGGGAISCPES
jgi:hypothetical protein